MTKEKICALSFQKVFEAITNKALKKNRTKEEVVAVTTWLTGYSEADIQKASEDGTTYGDFFQNAPAMNPNRELITGSVCGVKLALIEDPLIKDMCYLDKLIDELAKGKPLEKVLRKGSEGL